MADVKDILAAIPSLSNEEIDKIQQACSVAKSLTPNSKSIETEDERFLLFYELLTTTLRDTIGGKRRGRIVDLPARVRKLLKDGWVEVEALLIKAEKKPTHRARLLFYQLVIDITIDFLNEIEIPVSLRTITQQLKNCGSIVNNQFPGYLRYGMLPLILRWGQRDTQPDEEDL